MAVLVTNPMKMAGPWASGTVLDYHSVSATPTGDPYHPFEMKYTELGNRLFRFKYRGDTSALPDIVDTAEAFIKGSKLKIECIVPAPASIGRTSQPVTLLARELAKRLDVPAYEKALAKPKATPSMKNVPDWLERQRLLADAIQSGTEEDVANKSVLLVDDLVESGSTLRRAAEVLLGDGKASCVHAFALTRTR